MRKNKKTKKNQQKQKNKKRKSEYAVQETDVFKYLQKLHFYDKITYTDMLMRLKSKVIEIQPRLTI